jgi:hypothetical protein
MLAAAALALTACGGGADTDSAAPKATATTAAATTTTVVNVAADKAKARALVFTRSDLPAGWKAAPHQDDPTDKKFDDQLAACLGRPSPTTYLTARANSPDFASGDAEVSSEALLVRTVADFNADADAVQGPKFIPCVKRVLTSSLQQLAGASVRSVAVALLPVDSDAPTGSAAASNAASIGPGCPRSASTTCATPTPPWPYKQACTARSSANGSATPPWR